MFTSIIVFRALIFIVFPVQRSTAKNAELFLLNLASAYRPNRKHRFYEDRAVFSLTLTMAFFVFHREGLKFYNFKLGERFERSTVQDFLFVPYRDGLGYIQHLQSYSAGLAVVLNGFISHDFYYGSLFSHTPISLQQHISVFSYDVF